MLSKRWLLVSSLLLAAVLALLVVTPLLIRHYAAEWLRQHGGEQVQFQDVDFNPFTATLLLKGLRVAVNDQTTLSFDSAGAKLGWLPLLHKQVEVQAVQLRGLDLVVDKRQQNETLIGGIRLPAGEGESGKGAPTRSSWRAGITSVTLSDIHVRYLGNGLDLLLDLDHLRLSTLAQWSAMKPTQLEARGSLNGAPFEVSGELAPLAPQTHYTLQLALSSLPLEGFAPLVQERVQRLSGKLSFDGTLTYAQDGAGFSARQQGTVRVQALDATVKQPKITIGNSDATIDSKVSFSAKGSDQTLQLSSDIAARSMPTQP